jgi:hypothetical protein
MMTMMKGNLLTPVVDCDVDWNDVVGDELAAADGTLTIGLRWELEVHGLPLLEHIQLSINGAHNEHESDCQAGELHAAEIKHFSR